MLSQAHLFKHECKLHPFFGHAVHIEEAVQFKIKAPRAFLFLFLTSCQSAKNQVILDRL